MAGTFTARYAGHCANDCGRRIVQGDEVCYTADLELVHAECTAAPDPLEARGSHCPVCGLIHPGEC